MSLSDLFWRADARMARLCPFFPKSRGRPRVDDRRVLSGMIFINRNGLRWRDAPAEYGPRKTPHTRWKRRREKDVFARMLAGLAAGHGEETAVMIGATCPKAHRTATGMAVRKGRGRLIGRTKGGMNPGPHAIRDSQGRPLNPFVTAGQASDCIGVRALPSSLPDADWLLGERGHAADRFGEALKGKGIRACIPGRKQRKKPSRHDRRRHKRRNRIEIISGRLKDRRRVTTRYDRCPKVFLSAIALAATVMFRL